MDKEQVVELLKEVGEPIYIEGTCEIQNWKWIRLAVDQAKEYEQGGWKIRRLYTSDQVAAAILKATKPLDEEVEFQRTAHRRAEEMMLEQGAQLAAAQEEWNQCSGLLDDAHRSIEMLENQLATAEQRVAEACADFYQDNLNNGVPFIAKRMRNGEWRKFVKEV